MNWDAIGAIGEIVGALAVVLSLVYLATQIRAQNRESKVSSVHEILEAYRQTVMTLQDKDMAAIYLKAVEKPETLSDQERVQFIGFSQCTFRVSEEAFFQWKQGRLNDHLWNGMKTLVTDFASTKGGHEFWELRKHAYSEDFVRYMQTQESGNYKIR